VAYAAVVPPCIPASPIKTRDQALHLVRVDPSKARLKTLVVSQLGGANLTAAGWAKKHRLALVINLGMYQNDHRTHVGYARTSGHINSRSWVGQYLSALALDPRRPKLSPAAAMVDLAPGRGKALLDRYGTVVQNLRLIRSSDGKKGVNVWSRATANKRWSEAALAQDRRGRLLFVFARAPYAMTELNRILLELPLEVVRAQHLEGGPEASLSIHAGGVNLDLCGSYETGFVLSDDNREQWALPNVLGVVRR
jgi:Phosphodiester glycosidase